MKRPKHPNERPVAEKLGKMKIAEFSKGMRVRYVPGHAHHDVNHEDCEDGVVSSRNDGGVVFVKYDNPIIPYMKTGDEAYTAESTNPRDLVPLDSIWKVGDKFWTTALSNQTTGDYLAGEIVDLGPWSATVKLFNPADAQPHIVTLDYEDLQPLTTLAKSATEQPGNTPVSFSERVASALFYRFIHTNNISDEGGWFAYFTPAGLDDMQAFEFRANGCATEEEAVYHLVTQACGVMAHANTIGRQSSEQLATALGLLERALPRFEDATAPDTQWFKDYFLLTGEHMVLTDEGWIHGKNAENLPADLRLDEVNAPVQLEVQTT